MKETSEWWSGYSKAMDLSHPSNKSTFYRLLGGAYRFKGEEGRGYRAFMARKYSELMPKDIMIEQYPVISRILAIA